MDKILTISIAAYNMEKYINQALESLVLPEIIDELEIFVIDDGGTDTTLEIAKYYAEQYPNSIFPIHKTNGGYGSTINYSINHATGKYFKQLDGDDWFNKENLVEFVKLLQFINVDCVTSAMLQFSEKNGKIEKKDANDYLKEGLYFFKDKQLEKFWPNMYSLTFRTDILKKNKICITEKCFYTDMEYALLPIPYIETIYIWHKSIYIYRIGREGQSVSVEGRKKHYKEYELIVMKFLDMYSVMDAGLKKNIVEKFLMSKINEYFIVLCYFPYSKEKTDEMSKFYNNLVSCNYDILKKAIDKYLLIKLYSYSKGKLYPIMKGIVLLYQYGILKPYFLLKDWLNKLRG